eukprot:TRINITY_DN50605_c0_g1_i1.p1 TRINITY_DN50605_c0_g1~~TRINITY_DN50605_c0_g1_i1.p1  ORF type:complete len:355 (+),score=79.97 TRINITY_DN50605_c0_g1_i1:157-1221(+)
MANLSGGNFAFASPCAQAGRQPFQSLSTAAPQQLPAPSRSAQARSSCLHPLSLAAAGSLALNLNKHARSHRRRRQRRLAASSPAGAPAQGVAQPQRGKISVAKTAVCATLPNRSRSSVSRQAAVAYHSQPSFKLDVSQFTSEEAKERHIGGCGGPPEVETVSDSADNGVLAARGTLRVRYDARKIFEALCDPEENKRIFDNCSSVNLRNLLEEDEVAKTRLFEVSKTGVWTLVGLPFKFESTVYALEDWRQYQISFRLKKQGAMKHMSGFWRVVPVSHNESIVLFYNEAIPIVKVPSIFRVFAGRFIKEMATSLLEDLRKSTVRWHSEEEHKSMACPPGRESDSHAVAESASAE